MPRPSASILISAKACFILLSFGGEGVEAMGAFNEGTAGVVSALPHVGARFVLGGGTVGIAFGPPTAFARDLEFFAEVECAGEGFVVFGFAGTLVEVEHADHRFVLD